MCMCLYNKNVGVITWPNFQHCHMMLVGRPSLWTALLFFSLTWSTPRWGWHRSCFHPLSCLSVCWGFPQRWRTDRRWSSWWRWCFCPAGYTSLFQTETNKRQLGELLWDSPLRWGLADLEAAGRLLFFIDKDRCVCDHVLAIYTFWGVSLLSFFLIFNCLAHFTDALQFVAWLCCDRFSIILLCSTLYGREEFVPPFRGCLPWVAPFFMQPQETKCALSFLRVLLFINIKCRHA